MSDKDKKSGESYDDKEALRFHAEGKQNQWKHNLTCP